MRKCSVKNNNFVVPHFLIRSLSKPNAKLRFPATTNVSPLPSI